MTKNQQCARERTFAWRKNLHKDLKVHQSIIFPHSKWSLKAVFKIPWPFYFNKTGNNNKRANCEQRHDL